MLSSFGVYLHRLCNSRSFAIFKAHSENVVYLGRFILVGTREDNLILCTNSVRERFRDKCECEKLK
jgi:hypothetical protein